MKFSCQIFWRLICPGMVPGNAKLLLCKLHCNGCYSLKSVFFSFCYFSPVCFPSFVKKCNHSIGTLFSFDQLVYLACEARFKSDVFESNSVSFCIDPCDGSGNVATHTCADPFVANPAICAICGHGPTVLFCQFGIGDGLCHMFGRLRCHHHRKL